MQNDEIITFDKNNFLSYLSTIEYKIENGELYHSSLSRYLKNKGNEYQGNSELEKANIFFLLAKAASMMMVPTSLNKPFKPITQDFQNNRRSTALEDFTQEELTFFEEVIQVIKEPWLKALLADILWLRQSPKNINYARIAIDAYISHPVDPETWKTDIENNWHRAIRLSLQIRDFDRLEKIKKQLIDAFQNNKKDYPYMYLWIARLMDETQIDGEFIQQIADKISITGKSLLESKEYYGSRLCLDFSAKKYFQNDNQKKGLELLVLSADAFEKEADARSLQSDMAANSFYEKAIQAYRKIPVAHRTSHNIKERISNIRTKMSDSGQSSLNEMKLIELPSADISEAIKIAEKHVSGKNDLFLALLCFTGVYEGANLNNLKSDAIATLKENPLSALVGSTQLSNDGRVISKVPGINYQNDDSDPDNRKAIEFQMIQIFSIECQFAVNAYILPALRQLQMEYTFVLPLLEMICDQSTFVPDSREKLTAYALWQGFENNFHHAIHLLSPQLEHSIRSKLKEIGAHTSNIDKNGIENENGLSSLVNLPEMQAAFGDDFTFEIKAIFTEPLGANLRNQVAHGLLDDDSATSADSIYAWWMILKKVIRSIPFE